MKTKANLKYIDMKMQQGKAVEERYGNAKMCFKWSSNNGGRSHRLIYTPANNRLILQKPSELLSTSDKNLSSELKAEILTIFRR